MNKKAEINPQIVGKEEPHESGTLHVSGSALFLDDLPELEKTVHGAFTLSNQAHGRIIDLNIDKAKNYPGVLAVFSAADIPGENNCGPQIPKDPILAESLVEYHGQAICLVVAQSRDIARKAARLVEVRYEVLPALLDLDEAVEKQSWVIPPMDLQRGAVEEALKNSPHRLKGKTAVGGQEHFYLEGHASYAIPKENDSIQVIASTQHPTETQQLVAQMLGWQFHQVSVECRRMGGGFGGKETQSVQTSCAAALAAKLLGRPVKIRLDRDDDMTMTGKRHDFLIEYDVGFDEKGLIHGLSVTLASRCGYSADLSGAVNDRAIFHVDNCYYLDAVSIKSLRCKTNTVSNTAFRGFGGPQGMFAVETAMDDIARYLNRDPLEVRIHNFYGPSQGNVRNTTPYGMKVEDNIIPELVEKLTRDCRYKERLKEITEFNKKNSIIKKGIAITPVKFGISFTATFLNQAGAIVYIYSDGSISLNHGGTEMGQGLYTKIQQIVAQEFGLPPDKVSLLPTDTSRVPNTSATAASSSTDLNGKAAQIAAQAIKSRLRDFFAEQNNVTREKVVFENEKVSAEGKSTSFEELITQAYLARIKLWEGGFYKTPKLHYDATTMKGRPFFYFAYGAACSEVALDTLTGENRVLRVDILHDVGNSINPAIDKGQIQGGFIQGMGWLTMEELWWQHEGKNAGQLMTHSPSTYKIPAASDCPPVFNIEIYDNKNIENSIHRSKAVGEPPFMLGLSVFFALRDAVISAGGDKNKLIAPATPEAILRALGALEESTSSIG